MTGPSKELIERTARHVQAQLGLSDWDIRIHVQEVTDDISPGRRLSGASISYPEYKAADIYFDPEQIVFSHDELDKLVRHELMHVMLSPLVQVCDLWAHGDPARERFVTYVHELVTTQLERMPLWERE